MAITLLITYCSLANSNSHYKDSCLFLFPLHLMLTNSIHKNIMMKYQTK
ncbi:hypothetical protein HMPREF9999_00296 [Alloprevotella sp. oral taxon 473 str. F0040]|nr:hypothetical protein HMPREF9999_00296 [Alloprevotella sp. oral taxon 473 str. F0040]